MVRLLARRRSVLALCSAVLVSGTGYWLLALALPYAVYVRTHSALASGLVSVMFVLPRFLLAPVAGIVVDVMDRKRVMVATQLASAAVIATLLSADRMDALLWLVYPVTFVQAAAGQLFYTARQATIPALVERDDVHEANTAITVVETAASLAGPPLGGLLLLVTGLDALVAVSLVAYVGAAALVLALPAAAAVATAVPARLDAVVSQLAEGGRALWRDHDLRLVTLAGAAMMIGGGAYSALAVPFASGALHLDSAGIGVAFAVFAAAGLVTSPLAPRVSRRLPIDRVLAAGLVVKGAALAAMALLQVPALFIVFVAAFGVPNILLVVASRSVVLTRTQPALLGRVVGTTWAVLNAGSALGAAAASLASDRVGPGVVLLAAGAGMAIAGVAAGLLRMRSQEQPASAVADS